VLIHSILCPLDFSDGSRAALRASGRFARQFNASLHVLFVQDPLLASVGDEHDASPCPDLCGELKQFIAGTADLDLPAEPTFHVVTGDPVEEIDALAAREGIDLIVMGTHGFTGVRKAFFGSTTVRVLKRTAVPLLTVPATEKVDKARDLEGAGPILVLSDFGPAAAAAAAVAARLAEATGTVLLLVHVMPHASVPASWRARADAAMDQRIAKAHEQMCQAMAPLERRPIESSIMHGNVAERVAELARDRHAKLIVMGLERGETGSRPGATAYPVICNAPVPVLAVPAPAD
jgi:nucleotide-binding universal stress UspA family protein